MSAPAEALVAAEDAGLYRDAFGVMPPGGLPEAFLEPVEGPLERVVLRFARSRGPFTTGELARRYALEPDDAESMLLGLEARDLLVRGELRPGGIEREWCDPDVLRRIRRATLAALRREIEPAEQAALGRFLPGWHGIDRRATLREALVPLQGLALPVSLWESELLPRRVPGYQPASLDQICASGEVVWVGAGLDRVALYYREDAPLLGPPAAGEPLSGPAHDALRAALSRSARVLARPPLVGRARPGRCVACSVGARLGGRGDERRLGAAPREAALRGADRGAAAAPVLALARLGRGRDGRALVACVAPVRRSDTVSQAQGRAARRAPARAAGDRHARRRAGGGHSRRLRRGLRRAEGAGDVGACRRGYFVEGLGGAQFALPGAVERLRELRKAEDDEPLVLAAADPAQPYGGVLPWPRRAAARAARVAGAHVVLIGGEAALYVERGGRSLLPLREPEAEWLRPALDALVAWVRADRGRRLSVERFDGRPVVESDVLPLLVEAGFLAGPKRAVLRP